MGGGYFELLISYPDESQKNIREILEFMWGDELDGPYNSNLKEPNEQIKMRIKHSKDDLGPEGYGIIRLPNNKKAPCRMHPYTTEEKHYFICLSIPFGAMEKIKIISSWRISLWCK